MILYVRFHLPPAPTAPSASAGASAPPVPSVADAGPEAALPALLSVLGGLTPAVQALPPDAALVDVRGAERYFGWNAARLASVIRVRTLAHRGVDCTIGAGPNPMLARMAARTARPGTTLVLSPDEVTEFLTGKPVVALDGVGPATARTLCSYGLDSVDRLAAAPLATLQRIVGARAGRELHERARGTDRTAVVPNAAARSLGGERSFPRDELDPDRLRRALLSLTEELGARLRGTGQVCGSLTLTVRYADRSTTTRSRALRESTAHSPALTALAYAIHESLGLQRARVRGVSLRAEGLTPAELASRQLTFDPADGRSRRIEAAADRARARFGPTAVVPGTLADAA
ncbi:helix-hairpin-helix domain-containing protein [Streptomyces sp. cg36]|uniref:DNA polymerase Y family protein n=1 Tax=Streptomyces sp. cg36 TaxID=3238798 RepID=UPI0034E1C676